MKEDGSDLFGSMMHEVINKQELKQPKNIEVDISCSISEIFYGTVKIVKYTQEYPNTNQLIITWETEKWIIISPGHNEQVKMIFKGEGNHGIDHH